MGLMRHLTRSKRPESLLRSPFKGRPEISLPTQLLSSSNMLAYTAPNVAAMQSVSSNASQHSFGDESLSATDPGLTDASSDTSTSSPNSPIERSNAYFTREEQDSPSKFAANNTPASTVDSTPAATPAYELEDPFTVAQTNPNAPAPALPRRAPSHSKREHVRLAHCRSLRASVRSSVNSATDSVDHGLLSVPSNTAVTAISEEQEQPSSQELTQQRKAVRNFGGSDNFGTDSVSESYSPEEDAEIMHGLGLSKWRASQYLHDLEGLTSGVWFDSEDFVPTWLR